MFFWDVYFWTNKCKNKRPKKTKGGKGVLVVGTDIRIVDRRPNELLYCR